MTPAALFRQRGMTLIELMVAMVLMLMVSLATVTLFNVSSNSYRTVDAGQELQDNARFAMHILSEAARSAGFQDRTGPTSVGSDLTDMVFGPANIDTWRVEGVDNSMLASGNSIAAGSGNGVNLSDALIIRFFGANLPDPSNPAAPKYSGGYPVPDGSMIDCSGRSVPYPSGSADVGVSAFYVKLLAGEPELYCKSWNSNDPNPSFSDTQIIRGVETFQVMYGIDTNGDDIPDRWISATSGWSTVSATPNWNNVVAIRVGMVLRGPKGSAQGQSATASDNILYPLGKAFTGASTEAGLTLTPANDGRLRRAFSATFMIRNSAR